MMGKKVIIFFGLLSIQCLLPTKILEVQYSGANASVTITRLNINGTLDLTFNNTGVVVDGPQSGSGTNWGSQPSVFIIPSNNSILLSGSDNNSNYVLVNYTITGTLNTNFNGTGFLVTPSLLLTIPIIAFQAL